MPDFQQLRPDEVFSFSCHPDISCFNRCCRDLNQFLTPYDILRLKNRLNLPSREFLREYTESHMGPRTGLPVVSLRMPAEQGRTCPFVSPKGCTVYEDRPGACRTYPLGRMAARKPGERACRESYFLIREPHCRGFQEAKEWTVTEWKNNQRLDAYNEMNDLMMDLVSLQNRSGRKTLTRDETDLFCMACYDLDRFKDFLREDNGQEAGQAARKAMDGDELALMRFGLEWIKERLFGNTHGVNG